MHTSDSTTHLAKATHEPILEHYRLAAPLLEGLFDGTPLVYAAYPRGLGNYAVYHGALHSVPHGHLPTIDVPGPHGMQAFIAFTSRAVDWTLAHTSAVEFHGWGCTAKDPGEARFGRILLDLDRDRAPDRRTSLVAAARAMRERLAESELQAIPVLQGKRGISLWIPLRGVRYDVLRAALRLFCEMAAIAQPALFSVEPNTIASGRVHLHVETNAPGRFSVLPYSLRGDPDLHVAAPIAWEELDRVTAVTAEDFPARLRTVGDLFTQQLDAIGDQVFPAAKPIHRTVTAATPKHAKPIEPHGHILHAVAEILADGKPRDAKTILAEALARKLVPPETQEKYVYTSLLEYIVRTSGHGHKPFAVQDVDRRFRLNEPPDEWPNVDIPEPPPPDAATQALIERLERSGRGGDPTAFELAVCDAFAHLGFVATHVGGNQNPDGYADAPLGVLGYRTMLECKTGPTFVHDPDAVEASKFRDAYGAQVCAIVGSGFMESVELSIELQTHGVSAFTVDDLQQLLRIGSDPQEMRPLFEPGYVGDRIGDVLWERLHGTAKRLTLICDYVCETGWESQVSFAKAGHSRDVAEAPRLAADAAMLLVDQRLHDEGSTATCTRAEIEAAFGHLTDPLVNHAVWADPTHVAIVVTAKHPLSSN